jgi:tetratricopeptide (TPR) repeat protein
MTATRKQARGEGARYAKTRIGAALLLCFGLLQPLACASADKKEVTGKAAMQAEEIARLKRDIQKIDKSLAVTKELVNRSKGERYLPDLYFRQAELLIEKSRLVYFRILEEAGANDKSAVVAPEARLLKDQAIAVYRRILQEFKEYPDNDKITFFIAHEYRELGNFEEMIKTYRELVANYPKSNFRFEAWLILGDYHFDKGEIDKAIENYRSILKNPETYAHNMARYKMGWCWINKDKTKRAVDLWEQAVRTPTPVEPGSEDSASSGRLNVRREALKDLAFYFADARDTRNAIAFFEGITKSREEYRIVLEKLARRFEIKTMHEQAANVYRELISVSGDLERNIEFAQAVYDSAVKARDMKNAASDVAMLAEISARYKFWWRATEEEKKTVDDFELLARDLSTRLQSLAKERGDVKLQADAAKAYKAYLSIFGDAEQRLNMEWNYAEALFASKQFVLAGRQYEKVLALIEGGDAAPAKPAAASGSRDNKDGKQAMYSAILAYFEALKLEEQGTRFESMMAREGIKNLGALFVQSYPDDSNAPNVKFNVARAYFEQGLFDQSIELFTAFVKEHPSHKDAPSAAELALDAYSQKEDFMALAKAAREFAKMNALADASFRQRFTKMAEQAEQEEINRKTIASEGKASEVLASFIVEKKGTEVAAKALYQAFVIARDRRNFEDMLSTGRQLIDDYANTKYAKEVLPSLAEQSVRIAQVEQAASYYEEYARRFPKGESADELLMGAAMIRRELGEYDAAVSDFQRLVAAASPEQKIRHWAKIAEIAAEGGDWRNAEDAAVNLLDDADHGVMANTVAAEAALRGGDLEDAIVLLETAISLGKSGKGMRDGRQWLGRSQYLLGEVARKQFESVSFGMGDEGEVLQAKFETLAQLEGAYIGAIQAGDPEWAMGGLYRVAQAYQDAADFLDGAPAPDGLTPDEEAQYRAALKERADPLRQQGTEALGVCRSKAKTLEAFNRFVKACVAGERVKEDDDRPAPRPRGIVIPNREALEKKLIDNSRDVGALTQLIRSAIGVKDYHLARQLASRALELDEKNAGLMNLMGVATVGTNRMQEAVGFFKNAIRRGRLPEAYANLGALYALYGNQKKAADNLGKAGGVSSSSPDVIAQYATVKNRK